MFFFLLLCTKLLFLLHNVQIVSQSEGNSILDFCQESSSRVQQFR